MSGSLPARRVRVLFIEQFYYPDGWGGAELPLTLTTHLAGSGFDVEVICGSDQYAPPQGRGPPDPRSQGVRITRIPKLLGGRIHRAKLLRQLWFYLWLAPLLLVRRPPGVFVTQTNPPLAVILVAAAARLWRKPLVIITMDVYPEVLIAHGSLKAGSRLGRVLDGAFAWAYRQAQRVVALGPVMRERLLRKGVSAQRIVEIANWATGELGAVTGAANQLRSEWGLSGKFVLLYSGNLGLAHEFETLLRGLQQALKVEDSLRLVIIGSGRRLATVRQLSTELGLDEVVRFSDLLPAERLPESFGIASLAVVTLQAAFSGLVVPSKLQGYMARGVPVLYIGPDSDVSRFLTLSAGGVSCRGGDVQELTAQLLHLARSPAVLSELAVNARRWYETQCAVQLGLARYEDVLRSVLEQAAAPP